MGSIESETVPTRCTFMVPVYDGEPHSDPSTRAYMAPPMPTRTEHITFPLVDVRSQVLNCESGGDYSKDEEFMASHGFTAVKHTSAIQDGSRFHDVETMTNVYYREVEELVKHVTGCKEVVMNFSACRGGTAPKTVADQKALLPNNRDERNSIKMTESWHQPTLGQPIRLPHCDSTALGGRQSLRLWQRELTDAANRANVITREDEIGSRGDLSATTRESREAFEEKYNDHAHAKLGPRYASFSIWRPIKPITRDPLAVVPWSEAMHHPEMVVEPYDNRNQGYNGDWTRELAMLKIRPECVDKTNDQRLKFYYVSEMQPDEVLFVKMFDTAGLGTDAKEEVGCLHGSPDLGEAGYGDARESVEVRCIAFW